MMCKLPDKTQRSGTIAKHRAVGKTVALALFPTALSRSLSVVFNELVLFEHYLRPTTFDLDLECVPSMA